MTSFATDIPAVDCVLPRDPMDYMAKKMCFEEYEVVHRALGIFIRAISLYKSKMMIRKFSLFAAKAPIDPTRAHLVEEEEGDDRIARLAIETEWGEGGLFERITQRFSEISKFEGYSNQFETTLRAPLESVHPLFKMSVGETAFSPAVRVSEVDIDVFTNRSSDESSEVALTLNHDGVKLVKTLFGESKWSAKNMRLRISQACFGNLKEIIEHVISHCRSSLVLDFHGVDRSIVQGLRDVLALEQLASLPGLHKLEITTNFAGLFPEVISFGEIVKLVKGGVTDIHIGGGLSILEYSEDPETLLRVLERALRMLSEIESEFTLTVSLRCTQTPAWFPQETLSFPTAHGRIEVSWSDWAGEASEVKIRSILENSSI